VTFFVNVGTNALMLHLLPKSGWQLTLAWTTAQALATTINFIMLRTVVFKTTND
jgi:putative flippase GtrA